MSTFFPPIADFPLLSRTINGKRLVYLDNAATTQKPQCVIAETERAYTQLNANVHRGIYTLSEEATIAFEAVRDSVQNFINARAREEIIFTSGTTASINTVAQSWGRTNLKKGDHILLTVAEHHSNIVPWQLVAEQTGAAIDFIELTKDHQDLDWSQMQKLLTKKTKIFALTGLSNVLGIMPNLKKLIAQAHANETIVLVDGAQLIGHAKVDVQDLNCDFFAFSAHKMYGPTGVGVLYGKQELLEKMPPFLGGGDMIKTVTRKGTTWNDLPYKFEAGTPNSAGMIGFGSALAYLQKFSFRDLQAHEHTLMHEALTTLQKDPDITIYGPQTAKNRHAVIAFNVKDIHAHDLAAVCDEYGVAIRSGHHCAHPLMHELGVPATARVSFGIYNTTADLTPLLEAIAHAKTIFYKRFSARAGEAKRIQ